MKVIIVVGVILFILIGIVLMACVQSGAQADEKIREMWSQKE